MKTDGTTFDKINSSFYFVMLFLGERNAFQEVSGLSKAMDEEIVSADENRYKLPTSTRAQNLVLKRGTIPADSKLITWCEDTLNGDFSKTIQTHDIGVNLCDSDGNLLTKWTFHNAYPVRYSLSDASHPEGSLVVESIELAYTYFDISDENNTEVS